MGHPSLWLYTWSDVGLVYRT